MTDDSDDPAAAGETESGEAEPGASTGLPEGIPDPNDPPDPDDDPHVLPEEELVYPTFAFGDGEVSVEEGFSLRRALDREEMQSWLEDLAGGLGSHDVAVEGERRRAVFGVAPDDVQVSFDPEEGTRGSLSVTFSLDAALMRLEDAEERPLGARGGRGFIPLAMLTGDRDPADFRCYNWIDDPTEGAERDLTADGDASGE